MHVLYLVSTLRRAGPTAVLLDIIRHLDPGRFDPVVVTLSPEPADSMIDAYLETSVPVRSMSMSRMRALFHRGWRRDLQRESGIDLGCRCVVHSHGIRADVISSAGLAGVPRLATVHNYPYEDYVMKYGPLQGRWMAWSHLRAYRALPTVVACSSTLAERLRQHSIAATVIRNGVDTTKFCAASSEERLRLRSELGLPRESRVGVCVGALSERKQPLSVVRAAKAIDDPSLVMLFAGGGSLEAECRLEARGDDRIRFLGQVAEPAPVMRAADFFVSASRSEGLPVAALEASACGLHTILSDIGPHRELLALAPDSGELFPAGDRRALTASIRRAAGGVPPPTRAATAARAEILGAKGMSRRYQELYLSLARADGHVACP
jgi:glycosyltransferase involved in cell wall biosynthesis